MSPVSVNRFALKYDPATLAVEYSSHGSIFHKKIRIKNIERLNKTKLVDKLISKYADILGPGSVDRHQLLQLIERLAAGKPDPGDPGMDRGSERGARGSSSSIQGAEEIVPPEHADVDAAAAAAAAAETDMETPMAPATHVFSSNTMVFGRAAQGATGGAAHPAYCGGGKDSGDEGGEADGDTYGDLNKKSDFEIAAAKARMSVDFEKKRLKPDDTGFEWDVRADFDAEESNEWDEESD